ncbi:chemotaxis protein CheB [Mucilaginibacter lutimaris]|uniref:Chemotaxis protein CheB n=1 Tax=Mucilaginibacter lutimaris TaxID=931629 RepID=A0ABW2ZEL3_9SPHI
MNNVTGSAENIPTSVQFPVVGIGASAGGLEAIREFVQAIPEKSGMAYVFVQHLNPEHPSALAEIVGKLAKIPVKSITDDIDLDTDHFYIVPENKIVTTVDGKLKLSPLDKERHTVKVIDLFFSSLAVVHQSFAVGVVLSGTLNDGTLGLQVIKAYGGITFAQDEVSATYTGMPKNAVNSGAVDFIMAPAQIVQQLLTINNPFHTDATLAVSESTTNQKDEDIYKQLLTVLRVRKNVDFGYYKSSTLKRRIMRRMALNNIEKPAEYLIFLRENRREQDDLYNDMLISVTSFFRDPASFKFLSDTIIPSILEHKNETDSLRIWVAGCATGEEAYSLAIAVQENLGEKTADYKIQIFATDISEIAIAKARTGIYSASDVDGISAARLQQYFSKIDGSYHVSNPSGKCVFSRIITF